MLSPFTRIVLCGLNVDSFLGQPGGSGARCRFIHQQTPLDFSNLELGGRRVLCWASLQRRVAKYACDRKRVISWAQPKPRLPLASLRQLASRASLEVQEPFGIHRTAPPLGPGLLSFRFSSANLTAPSWGPPGSRMYRQFGLQLPCLPPFPHLLCPCPLSPPAQLPCPLALLLLSCALGGGRQGGAVL